ncbi:MAG: DUF4124 domain-containing protein [Halioglobus sp.]|nr:DUF4124 domain-containing protein [Halioglobus sp.]
MAPIVMAALLLVAPLVFSQGIYRTTDENGNVTFTDSPAAGNGTTEEIGLQPVNRAPPPPTLPTVNQTGNAATESQPPAYQLVITQPANATTVPMGPGNFSVSASVSPALRANDALQLFLDGEPHGASQTSGFWDLTNIFRGAHDITVGVVSGDGETVATSEPVTVFVFRPSVNFKNR